MSQERLKTAGGGGGKKVYFTFLIYNLSRVGAIGPQCRDLPQCRCVCVIEKDFKKQGSYIIVNFYQPLLVT